MTCTPQRLTVLAAPRWALVILAGVLCLQLGAAPVFAQNNGGSSSTQERQKQLKQLKQSYAQFQKAAESGNYQTAYARLERAISLAEAAEQSGALNQLRGFQQKVPTNWGNQALKNENWEDALTHFERGVQWSPNDAYVHYGRGLALINMDSTEAGLESLQRAIEVGNETGNTRVSGNATERIRSEFVSRASQALSADNPSDEQINTALEALDRMREYVDPSANSLFYRATALYEGGEHQQAVETARQGLDMHQGSRSDAAKFYFIIGESHLTLGNTSQACQAFQNATYGDYQARANHRLENECSD